MSELREQAQKAREAWRTLCVAPSAQKDCALREMAALLLERSETVLTVNEEDTRLAREKGLSAAFIERLTLTQKRIEGMAEGLLQVSKLPDPVGEVLSHTVRPSGLEIVKRRVPIGVIGIIYESRPNVTTDAVGLCIKSGNAVMLRGGSDAQRSNFALVSILREALGRAGLDENCASMVASTDRAAANELMRMNDLIDVLIPRGGKGLIHAVVENATVPVIQTGDGVCHIYVDRDCDPVMARRIAVSAKISRPSVCNAAETLLVDAQIAPCFLPACLDELAEAGVEIRGCEATCRLWPKARPAAEADWDTEYNDLIYSVRVVKDVDEAIAHINRHGTRHSEAIVTNRPERGAYFQSRVDAAAVYVNASTRFTDGEEFGFGAEIGISNQKLHARGPMGLPELTTYKYEITGDGQVR